MFEHLHDRVGEIREQGVLQKDDQPVHREQRVTARHDEHPTVALPTPREVTEPRERRGDDEDAEADVLFEQLGGRRERHEATGSG